MKDSEDMLAEGEWDDCAGFVKVLRHPRCIGGHETDGIHGGLVVAHGGIWGSGIQ